MKRIPLTAEAGASGSPTPSLQPLRVRPLRSATGPYGLRRFFRAPQSVSGFAAAALEPVVIVLVLYVLHLVNQQPFGRLPTVTALLVFTLSFPGRDRFRDSPAAAMADIVASWLTLLALLLLFGYATDSLGEMHRRLTLQWIVLTPLAHWFAVRLGALSVARWQRNSAVVRRVAIVGGGSMGVQSARALAGRTDVPVEVVGYFDDRRGERLQHDALPPRLGSLADVAERVEALAIREVYFCLPLASQPRALQLFENLQGTTASIYVVPDVPGVGVIQGTLQDINGLAVVGLCESPFTGINALVKRISDIVISAGALVLMSPLLFVIALGVTASSPGPVLFRQRRTGLFGDEIVVYKFRSMRVVEDGAVIRQATRDDPRVTRFGRFIRRTSLDELPQLINVLQGRMSIVGPRPHAVAHDEMYRRLVKTYMVRHKARPGITGWAQVNGLRGETETVDKMQARVAYDLEYLRNWSLGVDLMIMWRTLRIVVADRAAY